jgi:predicted nuclease of predicted toxin-antitoxin system
MNHIGQFNDCKHVSDVGLLNSEDPKIWLFAQKNDYAIVTVDSDFYEIT